MRDRCGSEGRSEGARPGIGAALPWPRNLPSGHRIAFALTALLVLGLAVRGAGVGLRPQGTDLTIYLEASRAWLAGRDPGSVPGYLYLPSFAALLSPLTLLPRGVAVVLWAMLSLAGLVAAWRMTVRLLAPAGEPYRAWLVWAPLAAVLRPIDSTFANGQANHLVLAAWLAFALALARGRDARAGAWLGLSISLKVLPVVFLGWLLVRRSWRALASTLAVTAVLVLLLPAATLGVGGSARALVRWGTATAAPHLAGGAEFLSVWGYAPGQSLHAALHRLLAAPPADASGRAAAEHLASLPPAAVGALAGAVSALLVGLALYAAVRGGPAADRRRLALEAGLLSCAAVLAAPLVHKAHMVWLLPSFAAALAGTWGGRRRGPAARAAVLAAALLVSGTAPALVGRSTATWLVRRNAVCAGALLLYAVLAGLALSDRPGSGAPERVSARRSDSS